jgi:hypothetical protein
LVVLTTLLGVGSRAARARGGVARRDMDDDERVKKKGVECGRMGVEVESRVRWDGRGEGQGANWREPEFL